MSDLNKFNWNPVILVLALATLGLCIYIAMTVKKCKDDTKVVVDAINSAENIVNPSQTFMKNRKRMTMSPCDGGYGLVAGGDKFTGSDLEDCKRCELYAKGLPDSQGFLYSNGSVSSNNINNSGIVGCQDDPSKTGYGATPGDSVATNFACAGKTFTCENPAKATQ